MLIMFMLWFLSIVEPLQSKELQVVISQLPHHCLGRWASYMVNPKLQK
jgi:hypothetical protein